MTEQTQIETDPSAITLRDGIRDAQQKASEKVEACGENVAHAEHEKESQADLKRRHNEAIALVNSQLGQAISQLEQIKAPAIATALLDVYAGRLPDIAELSKIEDAKQAIQIWSGFLRELVEVQGAKIQNDERLLNLRVAEAQYELATAEMEQFELDVNLKLLPVWAANRGTVEIDLSKGYHNTLKTRAGDALLRVMSLREGIRKAEENSQKENA